jgi:O-antigen ligase
MMRKIVFFITWLFVFVIPWENFFIVPGIGTFSRMIGLVAFSATLMGMVFLQENPRVGWLHWLFLLFLLWCMASFYWSIDLEDSYARIKTYAQLFLLVFVVFQWITDEKKLQFMLEAFVLGCWIAVLSTIQNYYLNGANGWERSAASGFNPNDIAMIIVLGMPIAWYLGLKGKALRTWIYRIYPFVAPVAVALTASRSGLLIMIVAMSFIFATFWTMSIHNKTIFAAACLAAFIAFFYVTPAESIARWSTIGSEITHGSLNSRLYIWEIGLKVAARNPLLGVGAGAFRIGVERQLGSPMAPHNVYLSILVEQGVIGLTLFLTLLGVFMWKIFQIKGLERLFLFFLLGMWMLSAMSLNWEWRKQTWVLFTLIFAHIEIYNQKIKSVNQSIDG